MDIILYDVAWYFMIYAIIGWCTEVSFATLTTGKFVNRGFLNGPYCPIYGVGVVVVLAALLPLRENLLLLYIGSFLLTTIIEFITGFILEKVFHNKWWDYSDEPFNIKGYICLRFSIMWGFACTFIVKLVHPFIEKVISLIPSIVGYILISVMVIAFLIDCGVTIATILQLNNRLRLMDEIALRIHHLSDEIGENIHENVSEVIEKTKKIKDEIEEDVTEKREELDKLREQYKELLEKHHIGHTRLIKAFPRMKSLKHNEVLGKLREHISTKK